MRLSMQPSCASNLGGRIAANIAKLVITSGSFRFYSFYLGDGCFTQPVIPQGQTVTLLAQGHARVKGPSRPVYGSYVIESGMIRVKTPRGEKGAQLGGLTRIP